MRRIAVAASRNKVGVPHRTMLTSLFVDTESRAGSPMPMFGNPHIGSTCGLVYLHDVWGMDDQAQIEPNYLAHTMEIHVACPDYYRGYTTRFAPDAWHQAISCSPSDVIADCRAARRFLLEDCGCTSVGVYGVGIGSALALISATTIPWDCGVFISGLPPLDKFAFEDLISDTPYLLVTGTDDSEVGFSSATDYTYAAAEMARLGKNVRYLRASGMSHRFNDIRVESSNFDKMPGKKAAYVRCGGGVVGSGWWW